MAGIDHLIRNSDNQMDLVLTADGSPISGAWTQVDIVIGVNMPGQVTITRTSDGDGVSLDTGGTGILSITPADLTAAEKTALDALKTGRNYRTEVVVTSLTNDDGVVFGGRDVDPIYFQVSDRPT